jgi:hypothetical protein
MWVQSARYYQSIGDFCSPAEIFEDDLLSQLDKWITEGANIIMAIDANQDVYLGKLATALSQGPY